MSVSSIATAPASGSRFRTRYGVRRFADRDVRPDCFEVFDKTTGLACSFGGYRKDMLTTAAWLNAHDKFDGTCADAIADRTCTHQPARR